ncbi:pseudouridine-5'-phosphate glycosidase [Marinobacterium arenosum]|uniref:pseudouridine-5'-phosphate glycosidase n=1 Tax=Marinobacterium arenosum TaxID=2862496 RepID=UPI001C94957A|nr:pseudouridine-5'-phosphate glycosidase [Marinobacterium arenosum]MBY4678858.1 pseudouridine-5'-phosphate glycosidase [Marinobacterium arenosum]
MSPLLSLSAEVAAALDSGQPVVALESTLLAHGLPVPQNLATAQLLEQAVREEGGVPATIAVLHGRLCVGLDDQQLQLLAEGPGILKLSRRDLPYAIASQLNGATTVAATMLIAEQAGIRLFATGGIGGVHRDAEHTFDISADLDELARTSVAVVCAGAKSILDLPKTLEYLETKGVPVVGFGCSNFPAFYSVDSGLSLTIRLDDEDSVAHLLRAKWDLAGTQGFALPGGVLIAAPIPAEHAMPRVDVERAVADALAQASHHGVRGKALTPFLLARLNELTGGASLDANIALLENNARLAARIAVALAAEGSEQKKF